MRTSIALASLSVLALPVLAGHDGSAFSRRHAGQHAAKRGDTQLSKRQTFSNARFSFYDVTTGEVACGGFHQNGEAIVALNAQQFDGGSHCGETVTITYQGTTKSAKIVDECMGCGYGGLDLAQGFFTDFASADAGIIYGSWVGMGGGDDTPTTTKEKPKPTTTKTTPAYTPPPTTTTHKTTSTSVYTPPPTTTHTTSTTPTTTTQPSTSAKPTTSSAAPTTSSAPALPTAGVAAAANLGLVNNLEVADLAGTQNLLALNQAVVGLGYMVMV